MQAEATILLSTAATAGVNLAARLHRHGPGHTNVGVLVAPLLLAAVLLLAAHWVPDMAQGLAVVVFVTSIVMNGRDAMAQITASL